MSVVVTVRVPGDTGQFLTFVDENAECLRQLADQAKAAGCRHHRFAVGEDFVLVVDEWDSTEQFQQFFSDPQIGELMQRSGALGEPQITVARAIASADQF
jgi:hypothetical protein